ncbi:FmdB family zinc ribbon protein [Demequina sp.]|uniref:FmdB family zinc ribbon protein n=1 Tax=Demequina sp. TaxID=2050685 RepID=UPI0025C5598B|nr:FmdB family zinc ribbon protein [Demequina sp.]
MPTYSYACSACGHRFDASQSIHDDALTTCPVCEGQIRRVISAVGVSFKGSGFYRTDSRAAAKAGAANTAAHAAKPKAEPKPATSAVADPV